MIRPWFFLLLIGALAGCAAKPRLDPVPPAGVVLAFGDSLTQGVVGETYPKQLEKAIGRKVVNAGVSGEFSEEGLRRLPGVLDETKPALVILMHGGNDLLQHQDQAMIAQNLRGMIHVIRSHGAQLALVEVPSFNLMLNSAPFYRKIAEEEGVPVIKDLVGSILRQNDLKTDYIHPNAEGNRRLAQGIARFLHDQGAV